MSAPPRERSLRVAVVASYDVSDMSAWSGTGFYTLKSLEASGCEVVTIGALDDVFSLWDSLRFRWRKLLRTRYLRWLEPVILRNYGRQIAERLHGRNVDVVLCLGSAPMCYLTIDQPIAFMSDATFAGLIEFYPDFSNLIPATIRNGHEMERLALARAALAVYASDWAAKSAVTHYGADPTKLRIIPFGANIDCTRTAEDIDAITESKQFDKCRLLFVGVDWVRKGGDRAIEIGAALIARGIPTELHIVGSEPPGPTPDFVIRHGFISKKSPEGVARYDKLLRDSHFLVIPSTAEAYGLAFAEASSFGLPSLAPHVGGIPTLISDGINGFTVPADAPASAYCEHILPLMRDREAYDALSRSAFREYADRLNWTVAGRELAAALSCLVEKQRETASGRNN